MHKLLVQVLPIASVILVCHAIDSYQASAQTNTVEVSSKQTIANIKSNREAKLLLPVDSGDRYTANNTSIGTETDLAASPKVEIPEAASSDAMAQVTSVSQLSDVQPTDWAFQALQSLVERYGCIAGYPDSTYRGNRALTRYEFAAGLNACLDRINELIATASADVVSKADADALQKLQTEFAAELSALRGRVDTLEAATAELEANQFSTTTKLNALVWANVTGAFADGDVQFESVDLFPPAAFGGVVARRGGRDAATGNPVVQELTDDPEITFSNLIWLNFDTSFNGRDSLKVRLVAGNADSPANQFTSAGLYNTYGVPFFDQTAGIQGLGNDVVVHELFYSFPVGDNVEIVFGPRINWYRYFDYNAFTFILTGANSFNSNGGTLVNAIDRGSGAIVVWKPSKQFQFAAGYMGENTEFLSSTIAPGFNTSSDPEFGLFGGTYTATAEATYSPSENFNLRLLYNRTRIQAIGGVIGGATGEPIYGIADNGSSAVFDPVTGLVADGGLDAGLADTFGVNFDWLVTRGIGLFGRYTYAKTNLVPGDGEIEAQALQAGVAFPDLGKEGALLTISYVRPFAILDGRDFLVAGGGNGGVQYEFEANYYFPLTDNIALVPAFYLIANPNNFSDNPTIYVGNLRAQFSF
jgi:Carbohydrate-selective porin, OprB family/S-layer homology domain